MIIFKVKTTLTIHRVSISNMTIMKITSLKIMLQLQITILNLSYNRLITMLLQKLLTIKVLRNDQTAKGPKKQISKKLRTTL